MEKPEIADVQSGSWGRKRKSSLKTKQLQKVIIMIASETLVRDYTGKTHMAEVINKHLDNIWHAVDGIVDEPLFTKQRLKILWVLREPNGGDFDFMEYLRNVTDYPRWKSSYGLVVKVSRIILDELFDNENNWQEANPEVMKRIALINIKNTEGGSTVNWDKLTTSFNSDKSFLTKKIGEIKPDLIICGGTYHYIKELDIQGCPTLNLYHPNQRSITHKKYIEMAISQYTGYHQSL